MRIKLSALGWYRASMSAGLLLTLTLFLGHFLLPDKRVTFVPTSGKFTTDLYGFADRDGKSAYWRDAATNHWACHYKPEHAYGCGWDIKLSSSPDKGMDWRAYSAVEVALRYTGPAKRLRVFIRNYDAAYAEPQEPNSYKTMNMSFPVDAAQKPVLINLREFQVVSWWFSGYKNRLERPLPELFNITHLGVDVPEPGEHEVHVDSVVLVGEWLKTETLLLWMLTFWMAVFIFDGGFRFYRLYRKAQRDRQTIRSLEEKQRLLVEENQHLENLANTDPLTGLYNRAGLLLRLEMLEQRENLAGAGLMILDLDHFKQLNDRYGHDMGDKVLRAFASLLAVNLRTEDIFARLGGEEFVVVCRRQPVEGVHSLAEKLRHLASQCTFTSQHTLHNGGDDLTVTVSIGLVIIQAGEELPDALKRADGALYRAKQKGRNRVETA